MKTESRFAAMVMALRARLETPTGARAVPARSTSLGRGVLGRSETSMLATPLRTGTVRGPVVAVSRRTLALLGVFLTLSALGQSQTINTRFGELKFTHDFANGYPTKETVEKLYDERDFQRACQAYLWAIPAVSFAEWQRGQASFGAKNGDIAALLSYEDRLGVLTPNATTPYYLIFVDLSGGPFVIDMPPNVRGAMSDSLQHALPDTSR